MDDQKEPSSKKLKEQRKREKKQKALEEKKKRLEAPADMALDIIRKLEDLDIKTESNLESKLKLYAANLNELVNKLKNQAESVPLLDFTKLAAPSTSARSRRSTDSTEEHRSRRSKDQVEEYRPMSVCTSRSSSASSTGSLSNMKEEDVQELIGIDFHKLANNEKHQLDEVIKLHEHDLDILFEKVYTSLTEKMSKLDKKDVRGGYPSYLRLEDFKSSFVRKTIDVIIDFIEDNFELEENELLYDTEKTFKVWLGEYKNVRSDILLLGKKGGKARYYLAVVEMKQAEPELGNKRCTVCMRACFDENGDEKPIHGICSNATHFNVLRYCPKNPGAHKCSDGDFVVSESMRFLFGQMKEFKDDWKENCTTFIRVIYSILYDQLELHSKAKKK